METHPNTDQAPSDGSNMWPFAQLEALLTCLKEIDMTVKQYGFA